MPDLQSELTKVLKQAHFDDDEPQDNNTVATTPEPTQQSEKNMTERVWDYLLANPMKTAREIADATGIERSFVSSAMNRFILQGNAARSKAEGGQFKFVCTRPQRVVMDIKQVAELGRKKREENIKRKRTARKALATRIANKMAQPEPAPTPVVPKQTEWSASALIDSLTLRQARQVYDELRRIFGAT